MKYVKTNDGSISAYNDKYDDYYHSQKDGAILETLYKHIIPSFSIVDKTSLKILDICFGLGYNSLFTLAYAKKFNINVEIFSPEKDILLLDGLRNFKYPKILYNYLDINNILHSITQSKKYNQSNLSLYVFKGDASIYLQQFKDGFFDIIYQDAFSPSKNNELWSESHFRELYRILHNDGVITTYSSSSFVRKNAFLCGFFVFNMKYFKLKQGSIFTKQDIDIKNIENIILNKIDRLN
ncbi:MnmC family methyltransferase [Helicobacter sp. 16-1353]|uniref:tRNA (5-methylaminomethyl-2-thiouridine)(34)-methyltransferase MnmD n=1 Tax=Helicobacter sp. 16-1353 TaxID=2004996 RepID=UPI0015EF96B8|nr:MnmC family methyltransferase [Helicobacter sp. 16-1353]